MLRTFSKFNIGSTNLKFVPSLNFLAYTPSFEGPSPNLCRPCSSYVSEIVEDDDTSALSYLTDLTLPSSWYPAARSLERRIIAHLGPTNSGKTHEALRALSSARSGVYCGPLRLLAWQVASQLNATGVPCSMVTGQEVKRVEGARHTSCTVEMASTKRRVDVAIVDEIQMASDQSRGWAFTRALLGLPAAELHVCGDPAVLPLLTRLCEESGEKLEVRNYERLSPLRPGRRPVELVDKAQAGDCFIAFSRREVHALRHQIEATSGKRCAVVYGSLPPAARSQQALLFNKPRSGVNVLAASDAVGMGLNLAIRRVIFTKMTKFDGRKERALTAAEVKQIAGRAGRYGSRYASGIATTLNSEDLPTLQQALAMPSTPLTAAALFPRFAQLAGFAGSFPQEGLAGILDRFKAQAEVGAHYFFAHFQEMRTNAVMLRHLPLTLWESYIFSISPSDPGDEAQATTLVALATVFSQRRTVHPWIIQHAPLQQAWSSEELVQLESAYRLYDLYVWLSYRFNEFEKRELAEQARELCAALIDASIRDMGVATGGGRTKADEALISIN